MKSQTKLSTLQWQNAAKIFELLDTGGGGSADKDFLVEAESLFFQRPYANTCEKLLFLERLRCNLLNCSKTTLHAPSMLLQEIDKAYAVVMHDFDEHETMCFVWNLLVAYSVVKRMLRIEDEFIEKFGVHKKTSDE